MSGDKTCILTCIDCGRAKKFSGSNVEEIIENIDKSGWDQYTVTTGVCKKCGEDPVYLTLGDLLY